MTSVWSTLLKLGQWLSVGARSLIWSALLVQVVVSINLPALCLDLEQLQLEGMLWELPFTLFWFFEFLKGLLILMGDKSTVIKLGRKMWILSFSVPGTLGYYFRVTGTLGLWNLCSVCHKEMATIMIVTKKLTGDRKWRHSRKGLDAVVACKARCVGSESSENVSESV